MEEAKKNLNENLNITVVGMELEGIINAVILAEKHNVTCFDFKQENVDMINNRKSPIDDYDINKYLNTPDLHIKATTDKKLAYENADFVLICVYTYPENILNPLMLRKRNTDQIEEIISDILSINKYAEIVIKSPVNIGFTNMIKEKYKIEDITYFPDFLAIKGDMHEVFNPNGLVFENTELAKHFGACVVEYSGSLIGKYLKLEELEAAKLLADSIFDRTQSACFEMEDLASDNNLDFFEILDCIGYELRLNYPWFYLLK